MKSFKENLADFQTTMGLSRTDLLELSECSEEDVESLEENSAPFDTVCRFCINAGIDYTTLYADSGWKTTTIKQQYSSMPVLIQKLTTNGLIKKLASLAGGRDNLKLELSSGMWDHKQFVSRLMSGSSAIDAKYLDRIYKAVVRLIPIESDFYNLFAKIMYSRIPSYNMMQGKDHFNLMYSEISKFMNISPSGVSNWGGNAGIGVPENSWKKLGDLLGGFSKEEFGTMLLTKSDFDGRKCPISLGGKLPDPLDEVSKLPEYDFKQKKAKSKTSSKLNKKPVNKKVINSKPEKVLTDVTKPLAHRDTPVESKDTNSVTIIIDDNTANKMFVNLSSENKNRVNKLIAELFFSQL